MLYTILFAAFPRIAFFDAYVHGVAVANSDNGGDIGVALSLGASAGAATLAGSGAGIGTYCTHFLRCYFFGLCLAKIFQKGKKIT